MTAPSSTSVSERLNAQFRIAQRVARIGSWELRLSDNTLSWSEESYRIFGMPSGPATLNTRLFFSLVHPDDLEKVKLAQEFAIVNQQPLDIEHRIVQPSGDVRYVHERAEFHVDEAGERVLIGTVHDITEQIRNKQKLQQSESRLRFASAMARMGAWEFRVGQSHVFWSDELCDILEVPHGTSLAVDDAIAFYLPSCRARIYQVFAACLKDGIPFDEESEIITGTGCHLWVRALGQAVFDEKGAVIGVNGAFQDVTRRKQSELDEARASQRLINTLESINDAVFTLDCEWRFTYLNVEAERLLKRTRSELLGANIWDEFKEAINTCFYPHYHRARREHCTIAFEEFYQPLGLWFEVRAFPSDEGLAIYFRDVTQARLAQDALRESVERFDIVAKATADVIWDWDLRSNSLWWSENFFTFSGFQNSQLEPDITSWTNRIHPEDKDQVVESVHAVIDGDSDYWSAQYRFLRKDGSYAYVFDRSYVIRDTEGKAIRMVGSMTDISAQKQSEIELARLNRALRLRSACDEIVNRINSEGDLLTSICQLALTIGGYRLAWVGYALNDERRSVKIQTHAGEVEDAPYLAGLNLSWSDEHAQGLGPVGKTIRSGAPHCYEDMTLMLEFAPWRDDARKRGFKGVINLPLRYQNHVFGIMAFYAHGALVASSDELTLLQEVADNLAHAIHNLRSNEERRLLASAVSKTAEGFSVTNPGSMLENLALSLSQAVRADGAFVARLVLDEEPSARTLAAVIDDKLVENFDYTLLRTPCEHLLKSHEWAVLDDVAERFPKSPSLARLGMQAYIGRRLDDAHGHPIGLLFALFRHPLSRIDLISNTLQIFASRAAAELERQDAEEHLREKATLLDKAKDAIIVTDIDNKVRFWNKGAERLYGWTSEEAIGRQIKELLLDDASSLEQGIQILRSQGSWSGETKERRKDGTALVIENHWTLVSDDDGSRQSIFAIKTDITQRKNAEQEIHRLAYYDSLTGLPNRRLLLERLNARFNERTAGEMNGALFFIDLDDFKKLNDTLGHDQGDRLLHQVGHRIKSCVREKDIVARLGGDEFVLLIDQLSSDAKHAFALAGKIGEKILSAFTAPFQLSSSECRITPSIGISVFDGTQSINDLLRQADLAMYQAKGEGRNAVRFFDPAMQALIADKARMEAELTRAIQTDEVVLYLQPQVDVQGRIVGAEALCRWQSRHAGFVPPAEFIQLAEESGLILSLGELVLRQACQTLAHWATQPALAGLTLAVNVSARQFRHPSFVKHTLDIVAQFGIEPGRLKLELTESLLVENVEDIIEKMTVLKRHGIGFSLDDFGTGYSSLMYLKRLPLDQLKIDQSFVRDVFTDPNDAVITRTIIGLGQSLGLSVIAEGVETQEQQLFLKTHGCDVYQGYLFSRPLPAHDFMKFVSAQLSLNSSSLGA